MKLRDLTERVGVINEVAYDPKLSKDELKAAKAKTASNRMEFEKDKATLVAKFAGLEEEVKTFMQRQNKRVEAEKSDRWGPTQKLGKISSGLNALKARVSQIR